MSSTTRRAAQLFTRYFNSLQQCSLARSQSTATTAVTTGKWQIIGAACITRPPLVCPPMTPTEQKYSKMLSEIEKENSLKCDHELRLEQDRISLEVMKSGDADEFDLEQAAKQTAIEFEDACAEELKAFKPTLPDARSSELEDVKSLHRALERSLVLVVKQKIGNGEEWVFPQTPWQPGETLRQTCERLVEEACGGDLSVRFLGNAPIGFYKYKYPKTVRKEGFIGAKVFFYKCQVRDRHGSVSLGSHIVEHQWLTQDELDDKFKPSYAKSVSQFLVSDR